MCGGGMRAGSADLRIRLRAIVSLSVHIASSCRAYRSRKIPRTLAENAAVVRPRTHYPFLLQYACTPAFSRASPSLTVDLGQATFMRRKVRPFPP